MPLSWTLLPDPSQVRITCLIQTTHAIIVRAEAIAPTDVCPLCGHVSTHVHSRYVRSVADTPWQRIPFQLQLRVRKFFCDEPNCKRRIFTERLPGLVASSARRTVRLTAWLCTIGFALGGQGGGRLLRTLGLVTPQTPHRQLATPATSFRLIRATPDPVMADPHVVSVDDWCFLRGQRYGALVFDLERHQMLDLLPNREAETVATWLQGHPAITVVSRDRGGGFAFADGAARGAPQAQQVADRFHLLKNLMEAFQRVLGREQTALRAAAEAVTSATSAQLTRPLTAPSAARAPPRRKGGRRATRQCIASTLREERRWRLPSNCVWATTPSGACFVRRPAHPVLNGTVKPPS